MVKMFLPVLVLHATFFITSAFDTKKGGWRPMSTEDVYKRFINTDYFGHYAASNRNMQILKDNAIRVVSPVERAQFNFLPETTQFVEAPRRISECKLGTCLSNVEQNKFDRNISPQSDVLSKNTPSDVKNRKPKTLVTSTLQDNNLSDEENKNDFIIKLNNSKTKQKYDNKNIETDNEQETQNVYEVIEDTNHFSPNVEKLSDLKDFKTSKHLYKSFENDNLLTRNLTNSFLSILNRYNIKPEDQSTNYALSRINNIHKRNHLFVPIPKEEEIRKPIPVRIPRRYNSQNHMSVDPLIAVFLSNYGYYLPNYYGVNNNYKNLYGYLASNNIHNNLPFGLYKIFSDTDSSN